MTNQPPSRKKYRRQILWNIYLPIVAIILLFLGMIILTAMLDPLGRSVVANWMLVTLALCPFAVLILFPIFLVLVASIAWMNSLTARSASPMQRLEKSAHGANERLQNMNARIHERVEKLEKQLTPVANRMRIFDETDEGRIEDKEDLDE